jgi:hypothetical protein
MELESGKRSTRSPSRRYVREISSWNGKTLTTLHPCYSPSSMKPGKSSDRRAEAIVGLLVSNNEAAVADPMG